MRILVIEDEKKVAAFIQKGFTEQGMFVDVAEEGEIGLKRAERGPYDLAIIDVMLPRLDGWSILRALRENGSTTEGLDPGPV